MGGGGLYSRYKKSEIFLSGDVQVYVSQGKRSRKLLTLSEKLFLRFNSLGLGVDLVYLRVSCVC